MPQKWKPISGDKKNLLFPTRHTYQNFARSVPFHGNLPSFCFPFSLSDKQCLFCKLAVILRWKYVLLYFLESLFDGSLTRCFEPRPMTRWKGIYIPYNVWKNIRIYNYVCYLAEPNTKNKLDLSYLCTNVIFTHITIWNFIWKMIKNNCPNTYNSS